MDNITGFEAIKDRVITLLESTGVDYDSARTIQEDMGATTLAIHVDGHAVELTVFADRSLNVDLDGETIIRGGDETVCIGVAHRLVTALDNHRQNH